MSTFSAEVLQNPDLVSLVLDYLSADDLLINAQRVRRSWRAVILSTNRFQQKLFFAPITHQQKPTLNPILVKVFKGWFTLVSRMMVDKTDFLTGEHFHLIPALQRTSVMHIDASWRRMLPVQPPPMELEILRHQSFQSEVASIRFRKGIRMGTLYDLSWSVTTLPYGGFTVVWKMFPKDTYETLGLLEGVPHLWNEGGQAFQLLPRIPRKTFPLCDKVTMIMDLPMPTHNATDSGNLAYRSLGYQEIKMPVFMRIDRQEASHIAQVCHGDCRAHQRNARFMTNGIAGSKHHIMFDD